MLSVGRLYFLQEEGGIRKEIRAPVQQNGSNFQDREEFFATAKNELLGVSLPLRQVEIGDRARDASITYFGIYSKKHTFCFGFSSPLKLIQ